MNLKDLKTREKLTLGFGILLGLTLLITIIGASGMNRIKSRTNLVVAMDNSQKEFLLSRVYMNAFLRLKNENLGQEALAHISKSIEIITGALNDYNGGNETASFDEYLKELGTYKEMVLQNEQAVKLENESVASRKKLVEQVYEEGKKAGFSEIHPVFSYFSLVRLNTANISIFNDSTYYSKVKEDLKHIESIVGQGKNERLASVIAQYSLAIDGFYKAFLNSEDLARKQIDTGVKITTLSDKIVKDATDFIDNLAVRSISVLIIISLLSLALGIFTAMIITKYFSVWLKRASNLAETYANGDFTYKFTSGSFELKDEIGDLARAMKNMGEKIAEVVMGIHVGAENLSRASSQISIATQGISKGAGEQAASVEEISSSMEEMTSSIMQNSDNAKKTGDLAISASQGMEHMAEIGQKSIDSVKQITSKINIINEIAFQTNILALNAAVEAARAGEHGKGFAVVAAEVRKLAERSGDAAGEIAGLSSVSLQITDETGTLMADLVPKIASTASLVHEIVSSGQEQNNGAMQVNSAIQQLNGITQQNAAASEALAISAEELSNQADQLKQMIAYFKIEEKQQFKSGENIQPVRNAKTVPVAKPVPDSFKPEIVTHKKQTIPQVMDKKGFTINLKPSATDDQYERF